MLRINKRWTALFLFLFFLVPSRNHLSFQPFLLLLQSPSFKPNQKVPTYSKVRECFDSVLLLSPSSLRDFKPFLSQAASYTELFWNVNNFFLCKYELLSTRATIRTSHLSFTKTCLLSPVSHVPLHVCFLVGAALFYGSFCLGIHIATWHLCSSAVEESG